jgi:hypothetical protein
MAIEITKLEGIDQVLSNLNKEIKKIKSRITKLEGIDQVLFNLNKEIKKIKGRTNEGLTLAALHVKGLAQEETPIDHGNLRASAYVISPEGKSAGSKGGGFKVRAKSG